MKNNNDISLGMFPSLGPSEEEEKALEKRMLEKAELHRNIERVASKLIAIIEADVDAGANSPLYNFSASAEALHKITSALSQSEAFASIPAFPLVAGWGRCAAE